MGIEEQRFRMWVLVGNGRAIRFYAQFGVIADGTTKVETRPDGLVLHELRYAKSLV